MSKIIKCIDCKEEKEHHGKGLCKKCYNKDYREEHKEEINRKQRKYDIEYRKRPNVIIRKSKYRKNLYSKNQVEERRKRKEYYYNNQEKEKQNRRAYHLNNLEKERAYGMERNQRPEIKQKRRKYNQTPERKKRVMELWNQKYEDPSFKILSNLRHRLWGALKGNTRAGTTKELVGCSPEYLINYLDSQFDDEMSWYNYGRWHVDHIIPCASFDFTDEEEQKKCFNYLNLQPMWGEINISKGCKII